MVEYDYKFCKYRSPEKHESIENSPCNCSGEVHGKLISSFFYGSEFIAWMSERQKQIYFSNFPFLQSKNQMVLSSVFSDNFFKRIDEIKKNTAKISSNHVIVGSNSWIKGTKEAEKYCETNGIQYETVMGLSYDNMLSKFAESAGFIFLPLGGDTCPRTVIEAKLLGCNLILNENVQHAEEMWFKDKSEKDIEAYLKKQPLIFWDMISYIVNRNPTISGYTTTKNCIEQDYPFEQSILSLLDFCDQVVVVDGGSTDGTWDRLLELSKSNPKLLIEKRERDWSHKRFAVFDGLQKAYARALCTGDFCWQQDSDEIVHENDYEKITKLVKQIPKSMNLIALPVIEYWGSADKVRADINPWKWRLSRNRKHITHGIPKNLRKIDEDGNLYSSPGSDGCDYIDTDTYDIIPCANFYTNEIERVRQRAVKGDVKALEAYENWFNNAINNLPSVHHYSWFDIERKIRTYKNYWSQHWQSLYDIKQEDTVENNMFFNKPWSEVTDEDICHMSAKLAEKMGGWIFHSKVDFTRQTPHIDCEMEEPRSMKNYKRNNV